ncbi:SDR family oxidoreductase [Pendulispora brunnea]|uniref:SDR family oxidoreductase n=1 Tax=Pendulispora brunnea TaxID=2905690 RepID=A0ABZ2KMG4_9BACT
MKGTAMPSSDLNGKVALVTGGSRGLGAAIAKRLAAEGANVVLTYVGSEEKARAVAAEIEATGRRALAIRADSADPAAVVRAVEETVRAFGGIDILVNNAGIWMDGPLLEATIEDFNRIIAVNVRAVFVAAQAAARHMKSGSRIINIGSNLADRVHSPYMTLYSMSKSALVGLTKGMARDFGPSGISVSLISPGPTDTDMNPANGAHAEHQRSLMAIPVYGRADEVAGLVAYVASAEGRSANGAQWVIDGGVNA